MNKIENVSVDFVQLIKDLNDAGVTQRQLEKRTGKSYSTIQRVATGENTDPVWSISGVIINLHNYWCKK